MYLVSEPAFNAFQIPKKYYAPIGQWELCQQVLRETQDREIILKNLGKEYLAIVFALYKMGVDFRIIYAHPGKVDEGLLKICISLFGCKLTKLKASQRLCAFPRDLFTILQGIVLASSSRIRGTVFSPYGEGGRILTCKNIALVAERLLLENKKKSVEPKGLQKIRKANIEIGLLPNPVCKTFSKNSVGKSFFNDHLDRIACLIQDKNGKPHLVLDPQISVADYNTKSWTALSPKESIERIKSVCNPMGIKTHCPKKIEVPYSLNLLQFPDKRILMTGQDNSVAETIGKIVGKNNIVKTEMPISFTPTHAFGGIRCLIGEAPKPLIKPL